MADSGDAGRRGLAAGGSRWLTVETLDSVDWLPADQGLIEGIREYLDNCR